MDYLEASRLSMDGHFIYHISYNVYRHDPGTCEKCLSLRGETPTYKEGETIK